MRTKAEVLEELRTMLGDLFGATAAGVVQTKAAGAHGYVDGYMRALIDLGAASRQELLNVVATERERASGPAMRVLDLDDVAAA